MKLSQVALTCKSFLTTAIVCCLPFLLVLVSANVIRAQDDQRPERGVNPAGSYALGDIETISMSGGGLMLNIPLASLPAGRGGSPGFSLPLQYNSKLYNSHPEIVADDFRPGYTVTQHHLNESLDGGWRYPLGYSLELHNRLTHWPDQATRPQPTDLKSIHRYKLNVHFPDGSVRQFHPAVYNGSHEEYYSVIPTDGAVYYSTDGAYIKLEFGSDGDGDWANNTWTLSFADGSRVVNGSRTYDRNGNYTQLEGLTYNNHPATKIVDQLGRYIIIEKDRQYDASTEIETRVDYIHAQGTNGEALMWTVRWKQVYVYKQYYAIDDSSGVIRSNPYTQPLERNLLVVDEITLPSQAGGLTYTFGYNGGDVIGTQTLTHGWGEINSITLPSGAQANYTYALDGVSAVTGNRFPTTPHVINNKPARKEMTYQREYDGTSTPVTETWLYNDGATGTAIATLRSNIVSIKGPDGGIFKEAFESTQTNSPYAGRSYRTERPDGTVIERLWQENAVPGSINTVAGRNPYVKTEFTSITDAAGNLSKTAIKDYNYDKNGNVTRVAEYDWVNYADVLRPSGKPEIPSGATPKRVTVNTYHNPTPDASDTSTDDSDAYNKSNSPRLKNAAASSEMRDESNLLISRTEFTYENQNTNDVQMRTGNLTEQRSWDSTKGAYSNPLSAANSVAVTTSYDAYGNAAFTTDAKGTQTEYVYGAVGTDTNLYPTEVRTALNKPEQLTTKLEYDFYTGLVTRTTDANNISSSTTYDAFGRPTLVKAAEGKPEETHATTEYDAAARRVIARSDLFAKDDGKFVSIAHYDQLGKVRLTRTLEDAATQSATNEQHGVKVQTRYMTDAATGYSYQITSNPYRAGTSSAASTETSMGWTLSRSSRDGNITEVETYGGVALPAPWGASTNSSGKVVTNRDGIYTTVKDQDNKLRRSKTDALGRLIRVDEPNSSNSLGTVDAPAQATSYVYDSLGNLREVQQDAQRRHFLYDSLGRLLRAKNPEQEANLSIGLASGDAAFPHSAWSLAYAYDANGNLTKRTDARGVVTNYVYDNLNRNTLVTYSDGTPQVSRIYDALTDSIVINGRGRLMRTETANSSRTNTTQYDALGRPTQRGQQFWGVEPGETDLSWTRGFVTKRSYNLAGGVISQTNPTGRIVTYEYDAAGRLKKFAGNIGDGVQRTYSDVTKFDEASRVQEEQFGTRTPLYNKQHFNARGQLYDVRLGTQPWSVEQWAWDRGAIVLSYGAGTTNNGNVTMASHYVPADNTNDYYNRFTISEQRYDYDSLNRLNSVAERKGTQLGGATQVTFTDTFTQAYAYDRFGNRTLNIPATTDILNVEKKAFEVQTTTNRLYAPGDLAETSETARDMRYDQAGNLVNDLHTGKGARVYDAEGRMTQAADTSQGGMAYYSYDGDGKRIRRTIGGTETWMVYGIDGELLGEFASRSATFIALQEFGYRNGQLLIAASNGDTTRLNRFIRNLFYGALGREPSQAELQTERNLMRFAGRSGEAALLVQAKDLTERLFTTYGGGQYAARTPARTDALYVKDLYYVFLQRGEDADGRNHYLNVLNGTVTGNCPGVSDRRICARREVEASTEFAALVSTVHGDSATEGNATGGEDARSAHWVRNAYLGALERVPDQIVINTSEQEMPYYARQLDNAAVGDREDVIIKAKDIAFMLFNSSAYTGVTRTEEQYVTDLYEVYLQRAPDPIALPQYATASAASGGRASVLTTFASMSAFRELAGTIKRDINWLVTDQLGTPRMVVDRAGTLGGVKRHDYLPFGEELGANVGGRAANQGYVADSVRQKFAASERDAETNLDYMQARYYGSSMGRFTSIDPIAITAERLIDPQRFNLYAYTRNNPLRFVDLDGEDLRVTTKGGRELFILDDGKKEVTDITAADLYKRGVQWFEPEADNYMAMKSVAEGIGSFSELKHFTWDQVASFAEQDRWMSSYRQGGSGDWKSSKEGADGFLMVTVGGMPYWADAVGQIPFAVNSFTNNLESSGDELKAGADTIQSGREYGEGKLIGGTADTSNGYDNYFVLRGTMWASDRYEATPGRVYGYNAVRSGGDHPPVRLSDPINRQQAERWLGKK